MAGIAVVARRRPKTRALDEKADTVGPAKARESMAKVVRISLGVLFDEVDLQKVLWESKEKMAKKSQKKGKQSCEQFQ
jgi:hypothetical protein